MNEATTVQRSVTSINVVEPTPRVEIKLGKTDVDSPTIVVDGLTSPQVMKINWSSVFDAVTEVLGGLLDVGGGGGGSGGCTVITITNPDKSTTEIRWCPPPKQA